MPSKVLSRILNRSVEKINSNSFIKENDTDDSFTSFYFDGTELNSSIDDIHDSDKTDNFNLEQMKEASFPRRDLPIFEYFEKEKKFLGVITDIDYSKRTFSANLVCSDDLITRDALFSLDDLSSENVSCVEVGRKIIYIYGKQYRNGTVTNVSNLYFRKEMNWTKREIEVKRSEANELFSILNGYSE